MSLTILTGFSKKLEDIYSLNLSTYVGTEVIVKEEFEGLQDLLNVLPKVDLIICASQDSQKSLIYQLEKYMIQNKKNIPLILVGDEVSLQIDSVQFMAGAEIRPIIQKAASILGVTAQDMIQKIVPEYFEIPSSYFIFMKTSECNVYAKNENEEYDILFESQELIENAIVEKLIKKGTLSLYIPKGHRLKFVSSISRNIISTLNDDDLTTSERLKSTSAAMQMVQSKIGVNLEGIEPEVINMADAAIESMSTIVENEKSLSALLANLIDNPSSYMFKHCQLITYLCFHAIDNMSWGNQEQKNKIAFVSFYHDIALEKDEYVKIDSDQDLAEAKFDKKVIDRIKNHAINSAKLISSYAKSPIGVETIIKQHHGSRSGVGFAKHYGDNISPLAIVFIVCEALASKILIDQVAVPDIGVIIERMHYRFTSEKYSAVLKALSTLKLS